MQQDFVAKNEGKVKKRNVRAGSKQTAKCNKRPHRELSSQHSLEVSNRRARVAEMAASGLELRQCEELLKQEGFRHADHSTLSRDLKQAREQLNQTTLATVKMHRDSLLKNLLALETMVRERGLEHDDYVPDLLAIFNQLAKLVGANADTRVSVVAVNNDGIPPEKLVGWRRWLRETQFISEEDYDAVWAVCRKLSKPPNAESTALCVPPADSPLWHDEEEEKGEAN
jgi:hypothetical protein